MSTAEPAVERGASVVDPMVPNLGRVVARQAELDDVVTLHVKLERAQARRAFQPGQFSMLYLPGFGEVPISISGDPSRAEETVYTIRGVGAVSRALCALQPGERVGVRGPFGTPWPIAEAIGEDVVIVAGGLGLAPLRPLIYHVLDNRAAYGALAVLYGTRAPGNILFRSELERWRARFDAEVDVTVDHARADWRGQVGVVTDLIETARFDPYNVRAFVCGPEVMMRLSAQSLRGRGVAAADIFLSMERNMQCAIGFCGHCQLGPDFICKQGPVLSLSRLSPRLDQREI